MSPTLKETQKGRQLRIQKEGVPTGCRGLGALMFRECALCTEGQEGFLTWEVVFDRGQIR